MRTSFFSISFSRSVCLALALALSGGCAGSYTSQVPRSYYYPQCYAPVAELSRVESGTGPSMVAGGVLGALLGAVGGYLVTGKAEGAFVGAAAGGAAGTALGYAQAQSQQSRVAGYLQQLDGDINGVNHTVVAARSALQCYDKQFQDALAAYKAGRISRGELQARYAEIRSGSQEAARIMGREADRTMEKERQYDQVLAQETRAVNQPTRAVQTGTKAKQGRAVSSARRTSVKAPVRNTTDEAPLARMAQQTKALSEGRKELQQEADAAASLRDSWAADLAAIGS